jgi:hypothetical protein
MPAADPATEQRKASAMALIHRQRSMVMATALAGTPWAAPVYYVYYSPGFYFFSSPRARHIEQGLAGDTVAAAIFADSDHWDQIQGLQMSGQVQWVQKRSEKINISARFIIKFPFAEPFLRAASQPKDADAPPAVGDRVRLYRFVPSVVFYLNNRMGFGQRIPVKLD